MSDFTKGFGMTPNVNIPLNKRDSGTIAPVAIDQLKPYREAAETWPTFIDAHTDEESRLRKANRCRVCSQNIWFTLDPNGYHIEYTADELTTLLTAHIRQVHTEVIDAGPETISAVLERSSDPNSRGGNRRDSSGHGDKDIDPRGSN